MIKKEEKKGRRWGKEEEEEVENNPFKCLVDQDIAVATEKPKYKKR